MKNDRTWMNEYPRPQLKRNSFINLNGVWKCNGNDIIIPFPPQAKVSNYKGKITDELVYEKYFSLPEDIINSENRLLLHFGAVDQSCEIYLNKYFVGKHVGGYLPFTFDISLFIKKENHLTVIAHDNLDMTYPYGKQTKHSHGMWYTAVSGIWQTVWLESVPQNYIKNLKIIPHERCLNLYVDTELEYKVKIPIGDRLYEGIFEHKFITIDLSDYDLCYWTTDHPYLYSLFIETKYDQVESYFAMRSITIEKINQKRKLCLNHQPLFLNAVLDQGYFPDGHFIPQYPNGYSQDIMRMKELGFNALRKHIKIEPDLYYYECDRLGMLVIQDMVNSGKYSFFRDTFLPNIGLQHKKDTCQFDQKRKEFFKQHCLETIETLYNHPSIIIYTIFNEGWGQFDSDEIYRILNKADPTRLYDSTSGWFKQHDSDFESIHMYFRNKKLKSKQDRPIFLSECGGYVRKIEHHCYTKKSYGYGKANNEKQLMKKINKLYQKSILGSIKDGLCGCVYTQLSDIENELNGLYTFDREICKVNKKEMLEIKRKIDENLNL